MKPAISNGLKTLGLSETEISAYISLLQSGISPASTVGKRAGLNRCTAKYSLENLCKKKLAMVIKKNGTFYFSAEDPDKILLLIKIEKEKLERKEKSALRIVQELKLLQNPKSSLPKVEFFEGVDGVTSAYESFLDLVPKNSIVFSYSNLLPESINIPEYKKSIQVFINKRIEKNIYLKYLMPNTIRTKKYIKTIDKNMAHIKIINSEKIPFDTEKFGGQILIYNDLMLSVFFHKESAFAYKVTQFEIMAIHQHIFDTLWLSI